MFKFWLWLTNIRKYRMYKMRSNSKHGRDETFGASKASSESSEVGSEGHHSGFGADLGTRVYVKLVLRFSGAIRRF